MKKGIVMIFIMSIIVHSTYGQNNKELSDSISEYEYWNYGMSITIQGGIWKPLGNLDRTFDLNPNIGLKWGLPITKQLRIELGTSINIPINSESFEYTTDDTTFIANSKNTVNGFLGLWVSNENRISTKLILNKYFGLGIGFIQTNNKEPTLKNGNGNNYSIETVNLNFGIGLRKIVFIKRSIGLYLEYNFSPYSLFGKVNNNFGYSSIITGVSYRF